MEFIQVGETISIGRTDGRIHAAVVNSKNEEIESITVAWTEGSKLMGKEIPWSSIVALNPHLSERAQENDPEILKEADEQNSEEKYK